VITQEIILQAVEEEERSALLGRKSKQIQGFAALA